MEKGLLSMLYNKEKIDSSRLLVQFEKKVDVIRADGFAVVIKPIVKKITTNATNRPTIFTTTYKLRLLNKQSPTLSIPFTVLYACTKRNRPSLMKFASFNV